MTLPALDPNWERWIVASIFKFIKDANDALAAPFKLYREGEARKTNTTDPFLELRIDGPKFNLRQSDYRVEVEVNILIQLQMDKDLYHANKISGQVCASFLPFTIAVLKLGNDPTDDASLVACLRTDASTGIIAHKYGIIQPSLTVMQGSVGTKYWVDLPA